MLWPLLANLTRLTIATGGGWLALRWDGNLSHLFVAQSAALVAFGLDHYRRRGQRRLALAGVPHRKETP